MKGLLLPLIIGFLSLTAFAQSGIPDAAVQQALVERHNYWRSEVGVEPLQWSDNLAASAYEWALTLQKDDCGFYHSEVSYGENLWMGTTGFFTPTDAIDSWASEKEDYNYEKNSCNKGKVCGHYTQIVWATTTQVGCASIEDCDGMTLWVCQYNPPGNWVGKKPY